MVVFQLIPFFSINSDNKFYFCRPLLVTRYWLLVTRYWLLVISYSLLVIGYWLLVIGYSLLVIGQLGPLSIWATN